MNDYENSYYNCFPQELIADLITIIDASPYKGISSAQDSTIALKAIYNNLSNEDNE